MSETICQNALLAWTRLRRAHQAALGKVEGALKAVGLPPLAWYDVLSELELAQECDLRPFFLERRLGLPQYGLSRLLAKIEEAGLIHRQSCLGPTAAGSSSGSPRRGVRRGRGWSWSMAPLSRTPLAASYPPRRSGGSRIFWTG